MRDNFNGILIMSDLDGTFFGKHATIIPRNVEAIKYLNSKGGRFTIASGRMHANLSVAGEVAPVVANAPLSLSNGSYVYDFTAKEIIDPVFLADDIIIAMIDFAKKHYPEVSFRVSTTEGFYSEEYVGAYKGLPETNYHILPMSEWPHGNWFKLVFSGTKEQTYALEQDLKNELGPVAEFCRSGHRLLEIQAKDCTKASRIPWFKDYYKKQGIDITVIACGDFDNDKEMLAAADIAICPSNALDTVKEICDYCLCDHTEGLIADIIEKIEQGIIKV